MPLAGASALLRPVRVWSVDDDRTFQALFIALLRSQPGVTIDGRFNSAAAVLNALREQVPPDVILLDVEMPEMSGVDAIPLVLDLAPATRVLMLSTFINPTLAAVAQGRGASACLTKVDAMDDIAAAIRRSLAAPAPQRWVVPVVQSAPARKGVMAALGPLWGKVMGLGRRTTLNVTVASRPQRAGRPGLRP